MSLMGHFSKRDDSKIRMPQSGRQPDNLGITYSGPVLNGEISPESMQREIEQRLAVTSAMPDLGKPPDGARVYTNADNQWWLLGRRSPDERTRRQPRK